jgi:dipeptidyl aminopeptidase/acylaminoacyl peptidase
MKKITLLPLVLIFASIIIFPQKKAFTIEDLYKVKNVGVPVMSPSGTKAAFTVTDFDMKKGKSNTDIYIMLNDGSLNNISSKDVNETDPVWITDNELFYLSGSKLFRHSLMQNKSELVAEFSMGISHPVLSRDKKYIAFISDLYPECGVDEFCSKRISESAEKGPVQAYIADKLLFRHWNEYKEGKVPSLVIYDIQSKYFRKVTDSDWLSHTFMLGGSVKFDISPDGKEICYIHNIEKDLASSTNADLMTINIETKERNNITFDNKALDGNPVYSPDGKYIAFKMMTIPGYESDRLRLALYNRNSHQIKVLTEEFDYNIGDFVWRSDSKVIYFNADVEGYSPLYSIDINTNSIAPVSGKQSIFGFDLGADDAHIYYMARAVHKPGEIYRINLVTKSIQQMTLFNQKLIDEVDIRPAEQMWVDGADGKKVHVFIVKPHNFDAGKKYPLILNVHGGPQSQWMDSFRGDWQVYPGAGYIVAFPNPHGSTGYGQEYTEAISGDWGGKVYEDLMKVTDALEQLPYVDKDRLGAMGWSFGGYMMNWFQAKTDRFKCLASMMGIFDLESMWGATEELWFVNWDLKGQPWNSEVYQKYSPSNYVENFSTPTLIIAGKKDYRVPYSQSVQYFTTLQHLGIDSRFILFKNDGHWPSHVKSMPLYYNAHLEWFNKYLGGAPAPYDSEKLIMNTQF